MMPTKKKPAHPKHARKSDDITRAAQPWQWSPKHGAPDAAWRAPEWQEVLQATRELEDRWRKHAGQLARLADAHASNRAKAIADVLSALERSAGPRSTRWVEPTVNDLRPERRVLAVVIGGQTAWHELTPVQQQHRRVRPQMRPSSRSSS